MMKLGDQLVIWALLLVSFFYGVPFPMSLVIFVVAMVIGTVVNARMRRRGE